VQLINGKQESAENFGNPKKWIEYFQNSGAKKIHIIDLDAALGIGYNKKLIIELIKKYDIDFQVGGGIKNISIAKELIQTGAARIIIGSKSLDKKFLKLLNKEIPKDKIMVALDQEDGFVLKNGWKTKTKLTYKEAIDKIETYIGSILSTDVSKEGLLKGPDKNVLEKTILTKIPVYTSGGFTKVNDIKIAERLGFSGVIIGRALYKNKLKLKDLW
jgi:phosphoribosylformimino-5-aminoimidazole carboxamide ribotide isomerase